MCVCVCECVCVCAAYLSRIVCIRLKLYMSYTYIDSEKFGQGIYSVCDFVSVSVSVSVVSVCII